MKRNKKELEVNELNLLINKGFTFGVTHRKPRGLFKREITDVSESYTIKEPTLAVLDLLSAEYIKIDFDPESFIHSNNMVTALKQAVISNLETFARIVAIAVLGEDYFLKGDKELRRLSLLFMHSLTPSKLYQIVLAIHAGANYADFLNSMRLMSVRTTSPKSDRIE
jgi:hypothetical protein